jgi:hypothetical protein
MKINIAIFIAIGRNGWKALLTTPIPGISASFTYLTVGPSVQSQSTVPRHPVA